MAKIQYLTDQEPRNWRIIGKLWKSKNIDGALVGRIGLKTKTEKGLIDVFKDISIQADEGLLIRPNTRKRDGKKDPDYLVLVRTGEADKAEAAKKAEA